MQLKNDANFNALTNKAEGFTLSCQIGENSFGVEKLTHIAVSGSLMDKPKVGNCVVRSIEVSASVTDEVIPKMAKIEPTLSIGQSVVKKGTFFIDVRNKENGVDEISFIGYDSMLKGEVDFLPSGSVWISQKISNCIQMICEDIGVDLDDRVLSMPSYTAVKDMFVGFPNADEVPYSDREMLGFFGVAMGGNWYITDENKLMLVLLNANGDTINVGVKADKLIVSEPLTAITKLILNTSDESAIFVWKENGVIQTTTENPMWETMEGVLEADYPLVMEGTDDVTNIAKTLFNSVYGYVHKPFSASDVELDMRAELGDKITVSGETFTLFSIDTNFDYCLSGVGSPELGETDSEYPYINPTQRKFDRKIRDLQTTFSVQIGKIESEISGKISTYRQATAPTNANTGDLWYCTESSGDYVGGTWYRYNGTTWEETSESMSIPVAPDWESGTAYKKDDVVESNGLWYKAIVDHTATDENKPPHASYWVKVDTLTEVAKSQITQTIDNITLSVSSGSTGSSISMKSGGVTITSNVADLHVKSVNIDGTLYADFVSATGITAGTLKTTNINLDGILKVVNGANTGGYLGYGYGNDGTDTPTNGVILASTAKSSYGTGDHYILCTEKGARMTSGNSSIWVSNGLAKIDGRFIVTNYGTSLPQSGTTGELFFLI